MGFSARERPKALALTMVCALTALTACTSSSSKTSPVAVGSSAGRSQSPAGSSTSVAQSSSTNAKSLSPGDHTLTVTAGGRERTFILHVPSTSSKAAAPLVLVYHGAGDTAAGTEQETDLKQVADARGQLVAFLQGYQNTWNEGAGGTPAEQAGVDDVAFTAAALAKVQSLEPVDDSHVAAVGFSNGALLVEYLGCRLAASLTLIVPVSGPLPVSVASTCAPSRPVSVLSIHGTDDDSIPYDGGSFAGIGGGTTVLSALSSIARWAALDGCAVSPATTTQASVRLTSYQKCRGGVTVALRTLVGAPHAWPSDIGEQVAQALGE